MMGACAPRRELLKHLGFADALPAAAAPAQADANAASLEALAAGGEAADGGAGDAAHAASNGDAVFAEGARRDGRHNGGWEPS